MEGWLLLGATLVIINQSWGLFSSAAVAKLVILAHSVLESGPGQKLSLDCWSLFKVVKTFLFLWESHTKGRLMGHRPGDSRLRHLCIVHAA